MLQHWTNKYKVFLSNPAPCYNYCQLYFPQSPLCSTFFWGLFYWGFRVSYHFSFRLATITTHIYVTGHACSQKKMQAWKNFARPKKRSSRRRKDKLWQSYIFFCLPNISSPTHLFRMHMLRYFRRPNCLHYLPPFPLSCSFYTVSVLSAFAGRK